MGKTGITGKQKKFCKEYVYDWNATRAYLAAYPSTSTPGTAAVLAHRLLKNDNIQAYIKEIQEDLEKIAGVSKTKVLAEHMKLAFSSIAHLHNTWIERKDFENLTDDQKACIAEISTQVRTIKQNKELYEVEFVKIKLYDKQKALDSISKMLGYDAAGKLEVTGKGGKDLIQKVTVEIIEKSSPGSGTS